MNTSLVPMTFRLRIPTDGVVESVCCTADLEGDKAEADRSSNTSVGPPKEFEIVPVSETLPAQSEMKITLNFVSNTIKKYDVALVVDVDKVGEEVLSLPISARSELKNGHLEWLNGFFFFRICLLCITENVFLCLIHSSCDLCQT